jgi:hypothetical protein
VLLVHVTVCDEMLQLQPAPVAAVGASFAGTTSVIVTVPDVVAVPEFVAVITYSASIWPCLKLPVCVLEMVRSGTRGAVTVVLADPQLRVVHASPGAAGEAPPDGSTDAKLVIVPGPDSTVAVIVKDPVPFALAAGIPVGIVAVHVSNAPGADGNTPQVTAATRAPPGATPVATTPAGS